MQWCSRKNSCQLFVRSSTEKNTCSIVSMQEYVWIAQNWCAVVLCPSHSRCLLSRASVFCLCLSSVCVLSVFSHILSVGNDKCEMALPGKCERPKSHRIDWFLIILFSPSSQLINSSSSSSSLLSVCQIQAVCLGQHFEDSVG